jgi:hypothetical protein
VIDSAESLPEDFSRLRDLLTGDLNRKLVEQELLLRNLQRDVEFIRSIDFQSESLPGAMRKSLQESQRISSTLKPTIDDLIDRSFIENKEKMVTALFPLLGPSIRKAVTESIKSLVSSIQLTIENATSFRSLRWRIEAARSGVPFSQIVLKNCFVFKVDHVFLIDRKTARILCHVSQDNPVEIDKGIFSGMLEAIKSFGEDVFAGEENLKLETLEFGTVKVLIYEGLSTIIALVAQGIVPENFGQKVAELNSEIHKAYKAELAAPSPNSRSFDSCDLLLKKCLTIQPSVKVPRKRWQRLAASIIVGILAVILVGAPAFYIWRAYDRNVRFNAFLSDVKKQENLFVAAPQYQNGRYQLTLLSPSLASVRDQTINTASLHGFSANDLVLRTFKTKILDGDLDAEYSADLLNSISKLKDLHLRSGSLQALVPYFETTLPVIEDIRHWADMAGRHMIVYIEYPDSKRDLAEKVLVAIKIRLRNPEPYDFHFLRTRRVRNLTGDLIRLEAVEVTE